MGFALVYIVQPDCLNRRLILLIDFNRFLVLLLVHEKLSVHVGLEVAALIWRNTELIPGHKINLVGRFHRALKQLISLPLLLRWVFYRQFGLSKTITITISVFFFTVITFDLQQVKFFNPGYLPLDGLLMLLVCLYYSGAHVNPSILVSSAGLSAFFESLISYICFLILIVLLFLLSINLNLT